MSKSATIWVKLQNHWFDPGAKFWEPGVYEMPEDMTFVLPSSAVVQNEDGTPDEAVNKARAAAQTKLNSETAKEAEGKATAEKTVGDTQPKK